MPQTSSVSIVLTSSIITIYTLEGNVKNCAKDYEDAARTEIKREAY